MKKCKLMCPQCMESAEVYFFAEFPETPYCECDGEAIDLNKVRDLIEGWEKYLADRKIFLEEQNG